VLESLWQISGLTARVDELVARNKALMVCIAELEAEHGKPPKNAGLFATAVARSEGERRGADAGKESPTSGRGAGSRRARDIYAERYACGAPLEEAGQELARVWDHVDLPHGQADYNPDESVPHHVPLL
jgi:hypothetical protein